MASSSDEDGPELAFDSDDSDAEGAERAVHTSARHPRSAHLRTTTTAPAKLTPTLTHKRASPHSGTPPCEDTATAATAAAIVSKRARCAEDADVAKDGSRQAALEVTHPGSDSASDTVEELGGVCGSRDASPAGSDISIDDQEVGLHINACLYLHTK